MSTAVVLSGGASLGAVQVGMLRALLEADVNADMFVGTSVGAVNAAWMATHPDSSGAAELAEIWRTLRRQDVFPTSAVRTLLSLARNDRGLLSQRPLRNLLDKHLEDIHLEQAVVPLYVVAVDVQTGQDHLLRTGPVVDALLASTAIPGVLPPVRLGGHWYVDGGVVNNTPISHAVALGADTVWVLPAGYPCARREPPSSALGMALHGLTLLVQHGLAVDVRHYAGSVDLRVVPPLCPLSVSPADFSHTDELIDGAYQSTARWLADGPDTAGQDLLFAPHAHVRSIDVVAPRVPA